MFSKASRSASDYILSLPKIVRFCLVGGTGLATDLTVLTLLLHFGRNAFLSRIFSIGFATLVTWFLNRMITFDRRPRAIGHEASRYLMVTLGAQSASYFVFATLVLLLPDVLPQVFAIVGAGVGAFLSFNGHKFISFAPVQKEAT